jgi:hypothetical protein
MTGSQAQPLSDLLPDGVALTLSGPDASRIATEDAAAAIGVTVEPAGVWRRAWLLVPWAAPFVALIVSVALGMLAVPVVTGAVDRAGEQHHSREVKPKPTPKPAAEPAPATDSLVKVIRSTLMPLLLGLMAVMVLMGLATRQYALVGVAVVVAPVLLVLPSLASAMSTLFNEEGAADPPADPSPVLPYIGIGLGALAFVAALSAIIGWLGLWASRRVPARRQAFVDARLAELHPYARGRVSATPAAESVTTRVELLIPTVAEDGHFDFTVTEVECAEFPAWAVEHAMEHVTGRRVELEELAARAEGMWSETATTARAARTLATAADPKLDARRLAELINAGDDDTKSGSWS